MHKHKGEILQKLFNEKVLMVDEIGEIWSRGVSRKCSVNQDGYLRIGITFEKKKYIYLQHQVVWVYFNGLVPEGYEIDHKDDNKLNNHPENLQLLTPEQNYMKQAHRARGVGNPSAKLSEEDVRTIRKLFAEGTTMTELCAQYPVKRSQMTRIINKVKWKHIS